MSDLVLLHHNEPMTTSLAIAEGTENTHQAIMKMVRTYVGQLQEFGEVGFQIRLNPQGSPTEFAFLNEPQATLLITFLRNSEIVVRFKVELVKAFYALRDNLQKIQGDAASGPFITRHPAHGADLAVAADRTFRSFLRAARSAGMALPAALRIANAKTVERTGMDMLAELQVDPDAAGGGAGVVIKVADPLAEALARWAADIPPGRTYSMSTILWEACGIEPGSKSFDRQAGKAGIVLRHLGFVVSTMRTGGRQQRLWRREGGGA